MPVSEPRMIQQGGKAIHVRGNSMITPMPFYNECRQILERRTPSIPTSTRSCGC